MMRTVSKLLLKSESDEHEVEHVGQQVDNAGVQLDARQEPPSLVLVHNFFPHKGAQLLQPAGKGKSKRVYKR
jgi:hypothetical protein